MTNPEPPSHGVGSITELERSMWNGPSRVRADLAKAVRKAGSQKAFAVEHGLSPSYINDVLQNRREISGRLAKVLGYERRVMYWREIPKRSNDGNHGPA